MQSDEIRVGLISDTHGLLRPEAMMALRGVQQIVHAGDVGEPEILQQLGTIAPVTAVRGNIDTASWANALHLTEAIQVGSISLFVLHKLEDLDLAPSAAGFHGVIYGHSHQPSIEEKEGILYVNPGSAGPKRFKLPVTVAILSIHGDRIAAKIVPLVP